MFEVFDKSIQFVDLQDVNDTDIESGLIDTTWEGIVPRMKTHDYMAQKNKGRCFIPATLKPRENWVLSDSDKPSFRNDNNIDSISIAVVDLDELGSREKAEELFKEYEYILYSTHSYTKDKPYKFRMVLKLDEPISADIWPDCFNTLISPIDADKSCGNLSRVFYFPSHNPSAGIRPYAYHNADGRALTLDDIAAIKSDYQASLSPEEREKFNNHGVTQPGAKRGKRHISGEVTPYYKLGSNSIDFSYSGMKDRLSAFLPLLIDDDNRHDFAMRASGSEVAKLGNRVDLFQLVQFLYKASTEHGSKPLTDTSGDTRKELPELISSAVYKFAPDLVTGDNPHFKDLRGYVREVVTKVEQIAITESWSFPSKPRKFNPMNEARKEVEKLTSSNIDNTYDGWRSRHILSIRSLVENGDHSEFAKSIIKDEFNSQGDLTNINTMGQFIFYCIKAYEVKVKKYPDINAKIDESKNLLISNVDLLIPENKSNDDKIKKFLETSFKIAKVCAIKDQWKFDKSEEPSASLGP